MAEQKLLQQQKAEYYRLENQSDPYQTFGTGKEDQKIPG